jgi:hypothetical protein
LKEHRGARLQTVELDSEKNCLKGIAWQSDSGLSNDPENERSKNSEIDREGRAALGHQTDLDARAVFIKVLGAQKSALLGY